MADPLSILGAIETSLNFTMLIYEQVKSFVNYKHDVGDLGIRFQDDKQLLEVFLGFFKDNNDQFRSDHISQIVEITRHLNEILGATAHDLSKFRPDSTFRRFSWGWVKASLEEAEKALGDWVGRLQTRFSMLPPKLREDVYSRMTNPKYETKQALALQNHTLMRKAKLQNKTRLDQNELPQEPQSEPEIGRRDAKDRNYWKDIMTVPLDIKTNPKKLKDLRLEVANLTVVLSGSDPKLTHIPAAFCWFERKDTKRNTIDQLGIAYKVPPSVRKSETKTLKDVIRLTREASHSLNERKRIATEISSAVLYLHGLEYVHKCIRSDNIKLTFERQDSISFDSGGLGHVNLTGFSFSRRGNGDAESGRNEMTFDWKIQIYCHPKRQSVAEPEGDDGMDADETSQPSKANGENGNQQVSKDNLNHDAPALEYFSDRHDIYSLGVVLLELGLWQDLEIYKANLHPANPEHRYQTLLDLVKTKLARHMGNRYAYIVRKCLEHTVDGSGTRDFCANDVLRELEEIQL